MKGIQIGHIVFCREGRNPGKNPFSLLWKSLFGDRHRWNSVIVQRANDIANIVTRYASRNKFVKRMLLLNTQKNRWEILVKHLGRMASPIVWRYGEQCCFVIPSVCEIRIEGWRLRSLVSVSISSAVWQCALPILAVTCTCASLYGLLLPYKADCSNWISAVCTLRRTGRTVHESD